jgi:hypothetical protein
VKDLRYIFYKSFSERTDVQELFILSKSEKKKIATWSATMCTRKLVLLYWLVASGVYMTPAWNNDAGLRY